MTNLIEPLEYRRLYSTGPHDLSSEASQTVSEIKILRTSLTGRRRTESADRRAVAADLRAAGGRANALLTAGLRRDDAAGWAHVFAAEASLVARGSALSRRAAADGVLLLKHPGNAAFQARVAADAAALESRIAALLGAVQRQYLAAEQTRNADLAAIVAANPSVEALPAQVQAVRNDEAATPAVLGATAALVQGDANRLAADVAGTPA
jgi:hypothetical protein